MTIKTLYIYIIFLLLPLSLFAQDTLLANLQFTTSRFSQSEVCFAFDSGEVAKMDFSVIKGKPARNIRIISQADTLVLFNAENSATLKTQIIITSTDSVCFQFYNKWFFGAEYKTKISKTPNPKPIEYDTLIHYDTTQVLVSDTTPVEVLDVSLKIPPQLNISQSPFESYYFELPEDSTTRLWAYWLGIGAKMSEELEEMAGLIPPEWAENGESPLMLYGLGKDVLLPLLLQQDQIVFKFSEKESFRYFVDKKTNPFNEKIKKYSSNNFGRVPVGGESEKKIYLNFLNKSKTIHQEVRLLVVAFTVKEHWETKVTERKEVVRKM